jgi:hypothetical protein
MLLRTMLRSPPLPLMQDYWTGALEALGEKRSHLWRHQPNLDSLIPTATHKGLPIQAESD